MNMIVGKVFFCQISSIYQRCGDGMGQIFDILQHLKVQWIGCLPDRKLITVFLTHENFLLN